MAEPVPAVSIVIPAYNRAATIRAAIESVLRQTWTDYELIVVDDGSTDGTPSEAAKVSDPRLRVVVSPSNGGAAAARNRGLAEARADWVAFQDSDDEWLPRKLEKQMARLTAPGADFVAGYCGMLILDSTRETSVGRLTPRYFPGPEETEVEGDLSLPLLRTSLISTQTLVVRRAALQAIGGFDESLRALEDWECAIRLARRGPVAFVDEPLVLQRFSPNSITRDNPGKLAARRRIAEKHADLLAPHPRAHARHHYTIAGLERRAGDLAAARASLARARALAPGDARVWATSAYVAALSLAPRAR
jgi:glycosyltransferase involved in cell wall biosynthesis